jgi:dihydroorotase
MHSLLITGGRVVDPANRLDSPGDVLILDGKVAAVGASAASRAPAGIIRMDAKGCVVCPGLIDLHVHLREPGQTAKETIGTGSAAGDEERMHRRGKI